MSRNEFPTGDIRFGWWDNENQKLAWQCWVFEKEQDAIECNQEKYGLDVVAVVYDGDKWVRLSDAPRSLKRHAKEAA
jgi:hypothetical protein